MNEPTNGRFTIKHYRMIQVIITIGLVLSIAGGSSSNGTHIPTTSKAGIVLYIIAFIAIVLVCVFSASGLSYAPTADRRIFFALLAAFPFIAVRILYSVLAVFLHSHLFSIYNGSVPVLVAMSVIEEIIVVFIYLLLGWFLPKIEAAMRGEIKSTPWSASNASEELPPPQYEMQKSQASPLPRYPMPFQQAHVRQDV
jgi:hypothetical protein